MKVLIRVILGSSGENHTTCLLLALSLQKPLSTAASRKKKKPNPSSLLSLLFKPPHLVFLNKPSSAPLLHIPSAAQKLCLPCSFRAPKHSS